MVLELMGRNAGWIAVESGLAGGADVILIPEIPWTCQKVAEKVLQRKALGKPFSVVVVAEGAQDPEGRQVFLSPGRLGGIGNLVGDMIQKSTGIETRVTVLGHIQRGGSPVAQDRILATRFGVAAARRAMEGHSGIMVAIRGGEIINVNLVEAVATKRVPPRGGLVEAARAVGISFGC